MVGELRLNFKKGRTQNSVSPRLSFALKRWDGKYIYIYIYIYLCLPKDALEGFAGN